VTDGAGARTTVVVAADDATVGEVLARILEAAGHEAIRLPEAAGLAAATASASADGVVLDLGPSTADQLRSLRLDGGDRAASVRAVAICTGPANALLAWQAGADAVLTRPFAADALRDAVREVLDAPDDERQARRDQQIAELSA
jgi:DNA-binding response OmpR family regulator